MRGRIILVLALVLVASGFRLGRLSESASAAGGMNYLNFSYNVSTQTGTWQATYTSSDTFPTVEQFNVFGSNTTFTAVSGTTCTTALPSAGPVNCNAIPGQTFTLSMSTVIPLPCGTPAQVALLGGFNVIRQSPGTFILVVPASSSSLIGGALVPNNVPAGPACPIPPTPTPTPTSTPVPPTSPPVIPQLVQNPAIGGIFNGSAKTPTPVVRPAIAPVVAQPAESGCVVPPGQGVAGICLRPPNTGDAGLVRID